MVNWFIVEFAIRSIRSEVVIGSILCDIGLIVESVTFYDVSFSFNSVSFTEVTRHGSWLLLGMGVGFHSSCRAGDTPTRHGS